MQSPPPFHGYETQQPKKPKTNGVVILFAVLGVILICCGAPVVFFGYYGTKAVRQAMDMGGCFINVDSMKRALRDYQKANDGKLPDAKTWQADISKYLETSKDMEGSPIKMWSPKGEWACEESGVKTGFAFNEDLSGKKVADVVKANPDAIAIFEVKTVAYNQSAKYKELPFAESPKMMSTFTNERRGWLLIGAEAEKVYAKDKKGVLREFDASSGRRRGNGFNISVDSNSDSSDNGDSKSENNEN
jgi:hypothetical protein